MQTRCSRRACARIIVQPVEARDASSSGSPDGIFERLGRPVSCFTLKTARWSLTDSGSSARCCACRKRGCPRTARGRARGARSESTAAATRPVISAKAARLAARAGVHARRGAGPAYRAARRRSDRARASAAPRRRCSQRKAAPRSPWRSSSSRSVRNGTSRPDASRTLVLLSSRSLVSSPVQENSRCAARACQAPTRRANRGRRLRLGRREPARP